MEFDLALPVDFALIANPLNWIVIIAVLLLVAYSAFTISENWSTLTPRLGNS